MKDLRVFLERVRKLGPDFYVEMKKPVSPELEVSILQHKLEKAGRFPVIYCPQVEGSKVPLVSNLFGSYQLMALAFDMDPRKVTKDDVFQEYRRRTGKAKPVKEVPASTAPIKDIILKGKDVDLGLLPITRPAILNSGRYIPIGNTIVKDPNTGICNVGVYRQEVKGENHLGLRIVPANHGAYIARSYGELGKPMEVVTFIGHHPAVTFGSIWNGNLGVNELELMGGYLGERLEVTTGETVDLPIPARAEIAIEGVVDDPSKMITDGPYSEWAGYYGEVKPCWDFRVTAITMRRDAIYHDLDPSHREHNLAMALGVQNVAYAAVKTVVPTVKSVYFPPSGGCAIIAYVSIKKRITGEGKRAALAAVNAYISTDIVVVVDEDIDVYNEEEVLWAVATRVTADEDIVMIPRIAAGTVIPTSYDESRLHMGGSMNTKMIIDATRPLESRFATRITPPQEVWDRVKLEDYVK